MSTAGVFDEPGRLPVINELNQALGFSEINITTWLCAWFADLGCLRQYVENLRASPPNQMLLYGEQFDSKNLAFMQVMRTCKLTPATGMMLGFD